MHSPLPNKSSTKKGGLFLFMVMYGAFLSLWTYPDQKRPTPTYSKAKLIWPYVAIVCTMRQLDMEKAIS